MPSDPTKLSPQEPTLFVVGVPLEEGQPPSAAAQRALSQSAFCIGESRKPASRLLRAAGLEKKDLYLLDHQSERDWQDLAERLRTAKTKKESVSLFSDVGLPILFDPGKRVLDFCRKENFRIRSVPGPTSWSTACALSGWEPPFLLVGFLPQEKEARKKHLAQWVAQPAHCVFMETPYRFTLMLDELEKTFGPRRQAFLAWELGKQEERILWGTLPELKGEAERRALKKGEFVLLVYSSKASTKV